jgi:hypothetical protein
VRDVAVAAVGLDSSRTTKHRSGQRSRKLRYAPIIFFGHEKRSFPAVGWASLLCLMLWTFANVVRWAADIAMQHIAGNFRSVTSQTFDRDLPFEIRC